MTIWRRLTGNVCWPTRRRRTFRRRLFAPGTWFAHLHGSFTLRSIPSGIVRQLLRGRLLPGTNRERRYFGRLSSPIFRDNRPVLRTLLEFGPHLFEQGPDTLKTFEQLRIARNGSFILFQTTGGSVEGHAPLLDQMIDQFQVFDIGRRKKTVALLVLLRAQDIEFRLPKTDQRSIDVEHLRHLAHRIE